MFCLFMMLVLLPLFFICEKCSKPVPLKSRTLAQTMLVYQPRRKRSKLLFCFYKIQYRYRQMTGKLNLFTDQFRSYNQVCGIQFLDQPDHPVYPSSLPSVSCWLLGTNRYFRGLWRRHFFPRLQLQRTNIVVLTQGLLSALVHQSFCPVITRPELSSHVKVAAG